MLSNGSRPLAAPFQNITAKFPVARARVPVVPIADERGVLTGTTWGDVDGFPAFTRMRLGQHTTEQTLASDWTMTHEFVHTALPSLSEPATLEGEPIPVECADHCYVLPAASADSWPLKLIDSACLSLLYSCHSRKRLTVADFGPYYFFHLTIVTFEINL